jgi:quinol monooxygenase YgiN
MVTTGLLVRLEAKFDKDADVEAFLASALPLVRNEPATAAWFAIRFGRNEYGIFDVFPDAAGRDAHLSGAVAKALQEKGGALFAKPPQIVKLRVLADRLPAPSEAQAVSKGLLLTFDAKAGHAADVEAFLLKGREMVADEPKTIAWFAIQTDSGKYGIFDVFPDNSGRFAHLTGHVPRDLAKHALTLLGSVPDMEMLDILAAKLF